MASFLKSLIEASKVPLYLDFRRGTLRDLSGSGNNCVSAGNERFVNDRGRLGILCPAGTNLQVAHSASLSFSQLTIILTCYRIANAGPDSVFPMFINKGSGAAFRLYCNTDSARLRTGTGGVSSPVAPSDGEFYFSVGVTLADSSVPRFFGNRNAYGAGASSVTVDSSNTDNVYIGREVTASRVFNGIINSVVLINELLPDADVVRLMRELERSPQVVRNPPKHFSIPYPAKTPAQYAAEGIVADFGGPVQGGEWPEFVSGNSAQGLQEVDTKGDGPFGKAPDGHGRAYGVTGSNISYSNAQHLTVEMWVCVTDVSAADIPMEGELGGVGWWAVFMGGTNFRFITRDAAGFNDVYTSLGGIKDNKWMHFAGVYDSSKVGNERMRAYIDGIEDSASFGGGMGTVTFVDQKLEVFGRPGSNNLQGAMDGLRVRNIALTPAQVRAEYLKGAKKCIIDARIRDDGSCPVTLSSATVGDEIANGWKVAQGTASVRDFNDERSILLSFAASPYITIPSKSAYGSWFFETEGNNPRLYFVSSDETGSNSYSVYKQSGSLRLYRDGTTIGTYSVADISGRWRWWISRNYTGSIEVWFSRNGSAWQQAFDVLDTTYDSSEFLVVRSPSSNTYFFGAKHYLG